MKEAATHEHRVLIVAPTGEDAAVLSDTLARDGLTPDVCGSIEELCQGIDEVCGTAIITEEAISPLNVGRLAQTIQRQPEWSDFPLILMVSAGTEPDRVWAVLSGSSQPLNVSVLERPVLTRTLLAAVRSALRSRNAQYRVARELRQRKEAEASLSAANADLQAFSYSLSHDLRAPLSILKGFSTLLLDDYRDKIDETGLCYLERIVKSADQMSRLIDDMLSLAKISRQEMVVQDVNLSAVARGILDELRGAQPRREVELIIHDNLSARGDEQLLKIALTNLLGNAWKFTSKMPRATIEFGCFHTDQQTVFFVRDNGAGFAMEHAGKLFTPFQRLHSNREFSGSGVGLATVHRVISRHGGRIWAQGEPGKGASFFFTLP